MNHLLKLLFLLSITWTACTNDTPSLRGEEAMQDTTYIHQQRTSDFYHAVFIDKNQKSADWKRLLDFSDYVQAFDESKNKSLKFIKERHGKPFEKFDLEGLSREWLPLNIFKEKYYLYAPCDWAKVNRMMLTESALIYWMMEGPMPSPLTGFKKHNDLFYQVDYMNHSNDQVTTLTIDVLDAKTQMSIWEYKVENGPTFRTLAIPKEKAYDYDLIVNYCENQLQSEARFPKIDFSALINEKLKRKN